MSILKGEEKVPGGKLLRIEVDSDERIRSVKLTGDFFLHPEGAIQTLEQSFAGLDKNVPGKEIEAMLISLTRKEKIEMIGFTPADIAHLLRKTLEGQE